MNAVESHVFSSTANEFLDVVNCSEGNVIVTGRTGSGKSSLIEALTNESRAVLFNFEDEPLNEMNLNKLSLSSPDKNIIVIDCVDPEILYSEDFIGIMKGASKKGVRFIVVSHCIPPKINHAMSIFSVHVEAERVDGKFSFSVN